ncbi:four-jointed box protein 1-like [Gigantopelta aegis]|uniref:four-jointed box protein 1-like n=1 Tax=Gigantopelta aegis TaxID=1735272 RepID=UPI001B88E660|nr:four-jointed box protein 1-like [Gigantopelta aegis]
MFKCLRMKSWGIRSVKALFLTAFSFTFCFILLLNVMVHRLTVTSESSDSEIKEYSVNQKKLRQLMGPEITKSDDNYIESNRLVWPDRKPKATNEKILNDADYQKAFAYQKKSVLENEKTAEVRPKHFNAVKRLQSLTVKDEEVISDKNSDIKNTDKLAVSKNIEKEENYVYEEDINKVVIKDDDDDDDDGDGEYTYDSDKDDSKNIHDNLKSKQLKPVSNNYTSEKCLKKKNSSRTPPTEGDSVLAPPVKSSPRKKLLKDLVKNGIYWSMEAEGFVPKGMSKDEVVRWTETVRNGKIMDLQPPSWERCGRPKNGFVVMKDGIKLCARYRHPFNKLVLGEVLSFYLSLLLKMDNVPAVLLSQVNKTSSKWEGSDPGKLGWDENQYVALIQWIDDIEHGNSRVQMPPLLFEIYKTGSSLDQNILTKHKLQPKDISNIIQWGSMIIFDYLTGNYDRVASMQDGAEEQNTQTVIQDDIRNLRKSTKTGKFWLIDNESGLLDAYELLYRSFDYGERFVRFHKQMLQTMCIFQHPLVEALRNLHNSIKPHELLEQFARKYEPYYDKVPRDHTHSLFHTMFSKRLSDVISWIQHCESRAKR